MKSKLLRRISVAIVAALFVTMSVLSVTLAKYTTGFNGSDGIQVAKWAVTVSDKNQGNASEAFTLALTSGEDADVKEDRLAPGMGGSFSVTITNASEVSIDYLLTFEADAGKPTNLKFYSDQACTAANELKVDTADNKTYTAADSKIALTDESQSATVTVYWKWEYETANGDATDTSEGVAASTMNVNVKVETTQSNPNA